MTPAPPNVRWFDVESFPVTRWKNGGGLTREIVRVPAGASLETLETLDWRVSIADLSASGPFSRFPGIDRILVLLSGAGVHLSSHDDAIDHRLDQPFLPFTFRGEHEIHAALLGHASSDLNVMTRRDVAHAELAVMREPGSTPSAAAGVLFAARGAWSIDSRGVESRTLRTGAGVWWSDETVSWNTSPADSDAVLFVVRVNRVD